MNQNAGLSPALRFFIEFLSPHYVPQVIQVCGPRTVVLLQLRLLVNPIRSWRRDRALRSKVVIEFVEVDAATNAQCRADLSEGGEVVTAVNEEVIDRNLVRGAQIQRNAVQLHVRDTDTNAIQPSWRWG